MIMNARRTMYLAAAIAATAATASGAQTARANAAPIKWADTIATEIDHASMSGDTAKLDAVVALANRVAAAYPDDGLMAHYQGYALYRQATRQLGGNTFPKATLLAAQAALQRSLATHQLAETHMLLSSIDGQLIGADPSKAMELGMESQSQQEAATSMAPNNPRVWLLRGQGAIFTPPEYGGGLDPAESQLKRAIELFASDKPKPGEPSWGRAEAYAWLGQVYEKKGDKANAAAMYAKALDLAPNYAFARSLAAAMK
jgi:tetratricopeptide (TPR) repeat protein